MANVFAGGAAAPAEIAPAPARAFGYAPGRVGLFTDGVLPAGWSPTMVDDITAEVATATMELDPGPIMVEAPAPALIEAEAPAPAPAAPARPTLTLPNAPRRR